MNRCLVFKSALIGSLLLVLQPIAAEKVYVQGRVLLAQSVSKPSGSPPNSVKRMIGKGLARENQGDFKTAIKYYDSAFTIAQAKDDELVINFVRRKRGVEFLDANLPDSARTYFLSVEQYSKKNGIDSLLADVQVNLGYMVSLEGRQQECLDYYSSALNLYEKNHDTVGIAGVMNNYSLFYRETGDYDKALQNAIINNSLLSKEKTPYLYVNSIITLGNIYDKIEEYDTALAMYEESYKLSVDYNFPHLINTALINKAVIYFRQQKYSEAENEFKRAIEFTEKDNFKSLTALLYSNLGIVYRNMGKTDLALESYRKALQIAEEIDDEGRKETTYINIGYLYKAIKNYNEAVRYYNMGLELAIKRNEKPDIEDIYENLAIIFEETGDYKKALSYLNLAVLYHDSVLNLEKVRAIEDMKAKYEKEKNVAQIKALQDENKIKELEKKSMREERNTALGVSTFIIFMLLLILYYFRMTSRKNRIIDTQRIQKLEDEKKLLAAQSVILGQENERKRIAQELHDGIGVLLSTASIHFSSVSKTTEDKKNAEMLEKAEILLKEAGGEVRKISQNMMPAVLSKFGLNDALEDLFDKLVELDDLNVKSHISGIRERMHENTEIMLYRIIQEMVNNTLKHASAKNIEFSCSNGNGVILIDYRDDGIGFDLKNLAHNSSLGIFGIQSRVDFLRGKVKLETGVGKGTKYQISIPFQNY